jgi:hypothetical protein
MWRTWCKDEELPLELEGCGGRWADDGSLSNLAAGQAGLAGHVSPSGYYMDDGQRFGVQKHNLHNMYTQHAIQD